MDCHSTTQSGRIAPTSPPQIRATAQAQQARHHYLSGQGDILESHIRELSVQGKWHTWAVDSWCEWWRQHQPAIPTNVWLAPTGTVLRLRRKQTIIPRRAYLHGPTTFQQALTHFWFPFHASDDTWSAVCVDKARAEIQIYGEMPERWWRDTGYWMDAWLARHLPTQPARSWTYRHMETGFHGWQDPALFCAALANWMAALPCPHFEAAQLPQLRSLLESSCREHFQKVAPVSPPSPASTPSARVRHVKGHALRKLLRTLKKAGATPVVSQAERTQQELQHHQEWQDKWASTRTFTHGSKQFKVITLNVGPRGLQQCLEKLTELYRGDNHLPAVIQLQDIKLTHRRARTIHDRMKRLMPDFTFFTSIRPKRAARRYNLGIMTLLRNDVAFGAESVPLRDVLAEVEEDHRDAILQACAGRVLLTRTHPAGAVGETWHLNVYQHTASAPREVRAHLWLACQHIIKQAAEQHASLILAGDLNAVLTAGARSSGRLTTVDKQLVRFVTENHGRAAAPATCGTLSWTCPTGAAAATLDNIIAFPRSVAISEQHVLPSLSNELDHRPVAVTFDSAIFGHLAEKPPADTHHVPRIKTIDYSEQEPLLRHAIQEWWMNAGVAAHNIWKVNDVNGLQQLLHGASAAYAEISGMTEAPKASRPLQLKGHKAIQREMDALFVVRKQVHELLQQRTHGSRALAHDRHLQLALSKVRRAFGTEQPPRIGQMETVASWEGWLVHINKRITRQREVMQADLDEHHKAALNRALEAIRSDFGRKRRTYRSALLRNPPAVPLWGVVSSHPDTIQFHSWTEAQARRRLPSQVWDSCKVAEASPLSLVFAVHSDVSAALEHIPAGECRVRQITQPRLVCTAENKLCGIEFYFGMNAVGVLPRCAKHLDTPKRDLVCLSRVVQGKRSLEWFE